MSVRVACKWLREILSTKCKRLKEREKTTLYEKNTIWNWTRIGNGYQILLIVLLQHCVYIWSFIVV